MQETNDIANLRRPMWVIWAALLAGPLIFLAVVLFVVKDKDYGILSSPTSEGVDLRLVFGAIAMVFLGVSFIIPNIMRAAMVNSTKSIEVNSELGSHSLVVVLLGVFLRSSLIAWAIAEGGTLLAGIAILLVGPSTLLISVFVLFLAAMLITAPTSGRVSAFVQNELMNRGAPLQSYERELNLL